MAWKLIWMSGLPHGQSQIYMAWVGIGRGLNIGYSYI